MEIEGSRILITGGASGIGLECATRFAARGAQVLILDNNKDALEQLRGNAPDSVVDTARYCDVGNPQDVELSIASCFEEFGGLEMVINNAGILRDQTLVSRLGKRIKKHSLDDWMATLSSNLTGTFLVAREVAYRWLEERKGGVIVNTSSVVRSGNPGQGAYSATKAAIDALTVTWSQELAPYKIRVAAIAYGFAETGMTKSIPPYFLERIRSKSPVGRFATVAELAQGVEFILENEYFGGKTLELDGGLRF